MNDPECTAMLDELQFAEEVPAELAAGDLRWKVLIVDDDEFVHQVTRLTIGEMCYEGRVVEFLNAFSAREARELLAKHPDTAVILLDVVMETDDAGLEFARYVRQDVGNEFVRIILRTGQPGQAPERKVITEYDINDYKHKAELSEQRLYTAITSAIRSYSDLRTIERSRLGMRDVISSCSELFSVASVTGFLGQALDALLRTGGVSGSGSEGALAGLHADGSFSVRETRGYLAKGHWNGALLEGILRLCDGARSILVRDQEFVARFVNTHTDQQFIFYVRYGRPLTETEQGLLHILGGNIAVALNNLFLNEEIVSTQREVVLTLGEVVETRSKETAQHVKRVAEYSYNLGLWSGLPEEKAQLLRMASPMHDVGKIGIPDSVLFKPGRLTEDEFALIKTHTTIGHSILKNSPRRIMRTAATIALQHHEHWDGSGYPNGLVGDETHVFGRITALADVFDALSCDRVYKKAWLMPRILDYLQEKRARQFDPALVDIFFDHLDAILAIRAQYPD